MVQAATVGKLPREVLFADAEALKQGIELPYARVIQSSTAVESGPGRTAKAGPRQANPLDHS